LSFFEFLTGAIRLASSVHTIAAGGTNGFHAGMPLFVFYNHCYGLSTTRLHCGTIPLVLACEMQKDRGIRVSEGIPNEGRFSLVRIGSKRNVHVGYMGIINLSDKQASEIQATSSGSLHGALCSAGRAACHCLPIAIPVFVRLRGPNDPFLRAFWPPGFCS